jgi:hypothetical protein
MQEDKVTHDIQRRYSSENHLNNAVEEFKSKGAWYSYGDMIFRDYPLGCCQIVQASVFNNYVAPLYLLVMGVDIDGSGINRDEALFNELFGSSSAPVVHVSVIKTFNSNINSYMTQYGQLLESRGFEKTGTRQWTKADITSRHIMLTWGYEEYTGSFQIAMWTVGKTL